jgi:hypothetical protein
MQIKSDSQRLAAIFKQLDSDAKQSLLDYAEFLQSKLSSNDAQQEQPQVPKLIPSPPDESVIQAVKRLSASYPMLDKGKLLNDTSVLVTEHTLQGRERTEVIADLEVVFQRHYQQYVEEGKQSS